MHVKGLTSTCFDSITNIDETFNDIGTLLFIFPAYFFIRPALFKVAKGWNVNGKVDTYA